VVVVPRHVLRAILDGKATELRLPVRQRLYGRRKRLTVRSRHARARVVVVDAYIAAASDMSLHDAIRCGFRTTAEFKAHWMVTHDKAWLDRYDERRASPDVLEDDELAVLFDARAGRRPVWVIRFELDQSDEPRFLAAGSPLVEGGKARLMSGRKVKPRPASRPPEMPADSLEALGYTRAPTRALLDAGEALSPSDYRRHVESRRQQSAQDRQAAFDAQRDLDRRLLSREDRIRKVERDARMRGIDVSGELWLLRRRMVRASDGSVEQRIQRLEQRVDRVT
jgi:hypothetical protein